MNFGATLGPSSAYERTSGATLEALWGHFEGTMGSLWVYSDDFGLL